MNAQALHPQTQLVEMTPARRPFVLISGILTVMLYFTTVMVVTSIMPQIQGVMSATADQVSWGVTFNLLATAIATPMTGWLVARFGRKRTMCVCVAGFGIATLMCGLSRSLEELIFWRILQGGVRWSDAVAKSDDHPRHLPEGEAALRHGRYRHGERPCVCCRRSAASDATADAECA